MICKSCQGIIELTEAQVKDVRKALENRVCSNSIIAIELNGDQYDSSMIVKDTPKYSLNISKKESVVVRWIPSY